jgi:hypothetical protein
MCRLLFSSNMACQGISAMFSHNANAMASLFARIGEWWRSGRQRRADRVYCVNTRTLDALQSECIVAARFPQ